MKSFCLAIVSIFLLGDAAFAKGAVSSQGGRFQLLQLSDYRRDQILLDTTTGKMWRYTCAKTEGEDCKFNYWSEEVIEGITASANSINKVIKSLDEEKGSEKDTPNR